MIMMMKTAMIILPFLNLINGQSNSSSPTVSARITAALITTAIPSSETVVQATTSTNLTALSPNKIGLIKNVLNANANLTWEIGTHAQALIEHDYPTLSVFSPGAVPPRPFPYPNSVNAIAAQILATKPPGILPLATDGSSADPAAMGVAVLLANWSVISRNSSQYGIAAYNQVQYLLTQVPRTSDGAISHRNEYVQLWADFVYMVPPFLAYYGALTNNITLMQEAFNQCRLYRNYLRTPSGLWRHIVLGPQGTDLGLWATGNAWAAAGMLRTLSTLSNSVQFAQFPRQTTELASWITEIVEASFEYQKASDSLFPNYFNQTGSFSDGAATALMAACSYRLAQLSLGNATILRAERSRLAIYDHVNSTTGILQPVVNPLNFPAQAAADSLSPEGQAFVLIMEASWRDWLAGGGINTIEVAPPRAVAPSAVPNSVSGTQSTSGTDRNVLATFTIGLSILAGVALVV